MVAEPEQITGRPSAAYSATFTENTKEPKASSRWAEMPASASLTTAGISWCGTKLRYCTLSPTPSSLASWKYGFHRRAFPENPEAQLREFGRQPGECLHHQV